MENEMKEITDTAKIDDAVIETMIKKSVLETVQSERETNRVILNAFAEMLSELKHLESAVQALNTTISICGNDKITDYFVKLHQNQVEAEREAMLKKKLAPKKSTKVRKSKKK